jgi:anaphase-promoting complex subunit 5
MSRYLTPPKIGLLALISLYVESLVPTAATIPLLSFIISQILPQRGPGDGAERQSLASITAIEKATVTYASAIPGRTVWDLLLKKLWEINSFDALYSFFRSLDDELFAKTRKDLQRDALFDCPPETDRLRLSRSSPIGAFIRRAQLEFTRLQLHDGIALWKGLIVYRDPTFAAWSKRNPTAGGTGFDVNLEHGIGSKVGAILYGDLIGPNPGGIATSTEDVERLLEFQVGQIQSMSHRGISTHSTLAERAGRIRR